MPQMDFDTEGVDTSSFKALPVGNYVGRILETDLQVAKTGSGEFVYVKLEINGPSHAGRIAFDRMLTSHPNPEAEKIGRGRLATLVQAIGKTKIADTDELVGQTVGFRLRISKDGERNDVTRYMSPEDALKGKAPSGAPAPKPAAKQASLLPADDEVPF